MVTSPSNWPVSFRYHIEAIHLSTTSAINTITFINNVTESLKITIINKPLHIFIVRAQLCHQSTARFGVWRTGWRAFSTILSCSLL